MPNLRPAQPSVVKPPIMMMGDERYLSVTTNLRELPGQEKVPSDAEIVSPDEAIVRVHAVKKPCQPCLDAPLDFFRALALLGKVVPGWFDQQPHGGRFESGAKGIEPVLARRFAARQGNLDTSIKQPNQVRHREFDDPPNPPRAQVIMAHDQMQDAGNF